MIHLQKTKILGIAPYEGIQSLMKQAAEKRNDIDLTVFVGDLENGAEIAKKYTFTDFDVIISRGGTAELIRQRSLLPVVEIPLSVYDILRSIKLAENYNNKYAVIGFPTITNNAHFLCDVLRYNLDIFTIHTEKDARETLQKLARNGYNMILCDMITYSLAQHYGIPAILITSGTESIEAAMEQAVQTSRTYRQLTDQVNFYKTVLEEQHKYIFVYNSSNELIYFSIACSFPQIILDKMTSSIPSVLEEGQKRIYCETSGSLFILNGLSKAINDESYVIYYTDVRKAPLTLEKNGIRYISKEEAFDKFYNSFFGITQPVSMTDMTIEQYAQSSQPLMILGEPGTGKGEMARLVYAKSKLCDSPLVTIDCSRLHERGWAFLTENDNSPLSDTNTTIYIKSISQLSDAQFLELFNIIKDLSVHKRNRILFTYSYNANDGMADRCQHLINLLSCLTLYIPSIRSHKNDIPNLASLYISTLNMRMAKEIIGFEPEALSNLQAYDWPYNFDQFKRVINELVTITDSPYIKLSSVTKLIKQEMRLAYSAPKPVDNTLNINRTLEEINLDILQQIMAEERGNQSETAKRLGISRTTLWRMLQKLNSPAPLQPID